MIESRRVKELSTHEEDLDGIKNGHPDSRVSKFERFTARYRVFSSFILLWRLPISANALNTANLRVDVTHVYVCNRSGGSNTSCMRSRKRAAEKRGSSGSFHLAAYTLPPSSMVSTGIREREREKKSTYTCSELITFFPHFLSDLI